MTAEESKNKTEKPTAEAPAQTRKSSNLGFAKTPTRNYEGCNQQSEYLNRDQAYLAVPIVTTGGSDHSQQEAYPLSGEVRLGEAHLDPFLDDLVFNTNRQSGWATQQHMRSPAADAGLSMKNIDALSPASTHSTHPGGRLGRPPKFDSRQESESQHPQGGTARSLQFGLQTPRQLYDNRDLLGAGRYGRELGGPRASGDYMAGLSFPPDDVLPDGRAAPGNRLDQAHRMFEEEAGLAADEAAGCMPSLDARTFMQEDDLLFPSAYGNQEGFHRQSMHRTGHGDYKADRHMASPGFMSRGTGRSRSGGLSSNAPVDDPMQRRTASGEVRDSMFTQLEALHMHRSASEGGLRTPFPPPGLGELHPMGPDEPGADHRARPVPAMQEEAGFRSGVADQSRAPPASKMNETPDFAMIYAFLGSMFDPVCHMIDHADVMNQMNAIDRETTNLLLANCVHNLGSPEFVEHVLYHGVRQASMSSRTRAPTGSQGYGPPAHGRHGAVHH